MSTPLGDEDRLRACVRQARDYAGEHMCSDSNKQRCARCGIATICEDYQLHRACVALAKKADSHD